MAITEIYKAVEHIEDQWDIVDITRGKIFGQPFRPHTAADQCRPVCIV